MTIKIDGKELSKAWHYDMCIGMWNWIAGNYRQTDIEVLKEEYLLNIPYHLWPENNCYSCEIHEACYHGCPFFLKYGHCRDDGSPYLEIEEGVEKSHGMELAIEIAQLFIDHYPEE